MFFEESKDISNVESQSKQSSASTDVKQKEKVADSVSKGAAAVAANYSESASPSGEVDVNSITLQVLRELGKIYTF